MSTHNNFFFSNHDFIFQHYQNKGASLVVQLVKNPFAMQKTWVWSLGWEDSPGEGKGPLQYSGLEKSMDYMIHQAAESQTRPSDFHSLTKIKEKRIQM